MGKTRDIFAALRGGASRASLPEALAKGGASGADQEMDY